MLHPCLLQWKDSQAAEAGQDSRAALADQGFQAAEAGQDSQAVLDSQAAQAVWADQGSQAVWDLPESLHQ